MRFVQLTFASLALLACTAPEESLHYELAVELADEELEFSIAPESVAPPEPEPFATLAEALDLRPVQRDTMWRVTEDEINSWLSDHGDVGDCEAELPRFPAVSSDGEVLALALVTAPVADDNAAVVRLYRVEDGVLLGSYWLLLHWESKLLETEPERIQKRYCRRASELSRLLADDFVPMPKVGGWQNPIREGLPDDREPWPIVVADGATREVDMAVADVVIAGAVTQDATLQLRPKAQRCWSDYGQFSTVWATEAITVFTRGPCGC